MAFPSYRERLTLEGGGRFARLQHGMRLRSVIGEGGVPV
jgi:hypothetical protein